MFFIKIGHVLPATVTAFALFQTACGETTAFKETELGRFDVSVSDDPNAEANSSQGTVAVDDILNQSSTFKSNSETTEIDNNIATVEDFFSESSKSSDAINAESETIVPKGSNGSVDSISKGSLEDEHVRGADKNSKNGTSADAVAEDQAPGNDSIGGGEADVSGDRQTMKLCAKLFNGRARLIKMVNPSDPPGALQMTSDTVLAVRLSGNKQTFNLAVGGDQKIAGLCIVATGNQPVIDISSTADMNYIAYVGRGNQSEARFTFNGGAVPDAAFVDLKGNNPAISFSNVGAAMCDLLGTQVNSLSFTCN